MGKRICPEDIVGNRYGMLMVEQYMGKTGKDHFYQCKCDCGNVSRVRRRHLLKETRSCGCRSAFKTETGDLIGKRYGKLLVKEYLGYAIKLNNGKRVSAYLCQCDCGNQVTVPRHDLKSNLRRTCGQCFSIEKEEDHYRYYCVDGSSWIFDDEDYELVKSRRWHLCKTTGTPTTCIGDSEISFYRMIMNPPEGVDVDHIDGDRTNNRRSNLRLATKRQNQYNKIVSPLNRTGYKGVTFHKSHNKYMVQIRTPKGRKFLGYYSDPLEAARAYDEAARFYFGQFACVNFPREGEQCCRRNIS